MTAVFWVFFSSKVHRDAADWQKENTKEKEGDKTKNTKKDKKNNNTKKKRKQKKTKQTDRNIST